MHTSSRLVISILLAMLVLACSGVSPVWAADKFLSDKHLAAGLTCQACHGQEKPGPVPTEQCVSCHGSYDELAKLTADKQLNPHAGHFPDLDCGLCHHGHKADELYCSNCH